MTPEQEAAKQAFVRGFKKPAMWSALAIAVLLFNALVLGAGGEPRTGMDRFWHIMNGVYIAIFLPLIVWAGYLTVRVFWLPFPDGKLRLGIVGWSLWLAAWVVGIYLAVLIIRH